ncbi:teichoic acid transport system permease protein [Eubacterium oxidoreducens]|uniref:Transport permease protein n=2 Tax=Eubacterium oxidoreducens TaxID=1732 RepID=A0A1G6AD42_EUBOX|nr:teichoic acid transport system permease protein [Eubacterium oxidoreducens]
MKRFIKDNKKFWSYILYAAKANLKKDVADSYLNWVWWVLEPFCFMLIYAFVFGVIFEAREDYFPIFIFVGLTAWNFFNGSVKASVRIVKKHKGTVSKIYLPKFVLNQVEMLVRAFKMLFSIAIIVIMMFVSRLEPSCYLINVIPLMLLLFILTFGVMCICTHIGVFISDLKNVINILLRVVFYMTGIFYSIDNRIGKTHAWLATLLGKWNPLAYIVQGLRSSIIYKEPISYTYLLIWYAISIGLSIVGVVLIYRNENTYVKVI